MSLKVKLSSDSKLERSTEKAAGLDLSSTKRVSLHPGDIVSVPTGVACQFPKGTYGRIAGRSSLASKSGLIVAGGVIDPDYTGYIEVILLNLGKATYEIQIGDRIAQLIVECFCFTDIQIVENLPETKRGTSGFGSTGK